MNNCLENIGANIRRIRKERGMTIEGLSERSGLSAKYLQGVETAKNNISVINLENIARALAVVMDDLIRTNTKAFRKCDEKLFHISTRLKRYSGKQLSFVYEMLDIIEDFEKETGNDKFLVTPRYRRERQGRIS